MKKVVVIGGGTGNFAILSGLKKYPIDITAVVAMSDDGGSTGVLRDDFGILPPGDVRQCLVALSSSSDLMRRLFNYRFDRGIFFGHAFGNLFITALERVTGDFEHAVEEASKILKVKGRVLPVTTDNVNLCVRLDGRKIIKGENKIGDYPLSKHKKKEFYLEPKGEISPKALNAILEADLVVIAPGNLYRSLIPNLLAKGFSEALKKSKGKFVYVANLVNKPGETDDFYLEDYLDELYKYSLRQFDAVFFNTTEPRRDIQKRYLKKNENPIKIRNKTLNNVLQLDLLSSEISLNPKADIIKRTFIRHDSDKVAKAIMEVLENKEKQNIK